MDHEEYRRKLYDQFARIAKAAAHPKRLELLDLLAQGERPVEALARETGQTVASASHHLLKMREAHLVASRKEGQYVFYRLADPSVWKLLEAIRSLAERQLAEVERMVHVYLDSRDALEPVKREELLDRVRRGEALVLDVRPAEEYSAGHIAGAVSIPLGELESRILELPKGLEIVAYCRGPYCLLAFQAVEILRKREFQARRVEDGFPEWQAAGFPVATHS